MRYIIMGNSPAEEDVVDTPKVFVYTHKDFPYLAIILRIRP